MVKTFVLDTNVLLHNPDALTSFADNQVVITLDVLEELDRFKSEGNDLGRNARTAVRLLDSLRVRGSLGKGVELNGAGGVLKVALEPVDVREYGFAESTSDNRIISLAAKLRDAGETVVFVSKDINARVKADALGVRVMDFEKQKVDFDHLYAGWREVAVSRDKIDALESRKSLTLEGVDLFPNEFVHLVDDADPEKTAMGRFSAKDSAIVPLTNNRRNPFGIRPRNLQQHFVMELLMVEEVQMVTLVGQAGTGKTLLALAAGLHQVLNEHRYEKILVSRPIVPLGRDIGYLPGSKEEKLFQWMEPIFDNLEYILRSNLKRGGEISREVKNLLDSGTLVLEALTYMRGRSIPGQFLIVDEAQNLTPHEVKTVVSRVGEDSKIVLTGDPYQIDNPYLDSSSNGLTYAAERMKSQELFGHVTLTKSERSELASIAAELL
ncbi:MAG: PhoH family protein [Planctomycetota bacterium]|jgi:PhoH-like ATPase